MSGLDRLEERLRKSGAMDWIWFIAFSLLVAMWVALVAGVSWVIQHLAMKFW